MKNSAKLRSIGPFFARLAWELRRYSARANAGYALSSALVALALVFVVSGLSDQTKAESQRKQFSSLRTAPAKIERHSDPKDALVSALPAAREIPVHLRNLYSAAEKAKVELTIAEYRTRAVPAAGYATVSLGITVESDFARIQRMLIDAMARSRTLTLESMSVQRIADNGDAVEARLNLQLYVRNAENAP